MLSLSRRAQEGEKSDAACACVCKCPRVCLFFLSRSFLDAAACSSPETVGCVVWRGNLLACCALSLFTLSSLRTKKKTGQAFIYCFACFLIAGFTIAIQGRDAPVHSFYESLSPVFWGKLFCCVKSWMVGFCHDAFRVFFFFFFFPPFKVMFLLELPLSSFYTSVSLPKHTCESRLCSPATALGCCLGS